MSESRREKEKKKIRKADAKQWADKQDSSWEPTSVKLPEGTPFLTIRPGIMKIDVLDYIAGKGNVAADEGFAHFERRYFAHKIPMPNGKSKPYLCLWETFKKPCPVCQWMQENQDKEEIVKNLRPQQRHLFNVIDVTDETERKKGIQIFDTTFGSVKYPAFGKLLKDKIQMTSPKYDNFSDPENGFTVVLKIEEDKMPGFKFNRVTNLDMIDRKSQYDDEMIHKTVCLDKTLMEFSFEELERILLQKQAEEPDKKEEERNEAAPAPAKALSKKVEEDEEEDEPKAKAAPPAPAKKSSSTKEKTAEECGLKRTDYVTFKGEECEIIKISGDGTSLTLENEDGEIRSAVGPEEVTKVKTKEDIDEDDDKPAKVKASSAKKVVDEPDDSDDDIDEDDD